MEKVRKGELRGMGETKGQKDRDRDGTGPTFVVLLPILCRHLFHQLDPPRFERGEGSGW
jgi:hypothetical protein